MTEKIRQRIIVTMFITRLPLVVSRIISRKILASNNYTKFESKIRHICNSLKKRSKLVRQIKNDQIPVSYNIKSGNDIFLKSSYNYNELLQICVLHLSAYKYPYHLLSILVKQTGLSNTTKSAWPWPKKTPSSVTNVPWLLTVFV